MAMVSLGQLLLQLQVDDTKASRSLKNFIQNLDSITNSVRKFGTHTSTATGFVKSFASMIGSLASNLASLGLDIIVSAFSDLIDLIKDGIKMGFEYNTTIEYTTAAIETLVGSQEEAVDLTKQMVKLAAETPFAIKDYSKAAKTLLGYGVEADNVMNVMEMLGDVSMGNSYAFDKLALAFGQVTAKGKLQAEEVRQLVNHGFNPLQYISERTGETMDELHARMKKGEIKAEEVTQAFEDATTGTGKFNGMMEKLSKTYEGQKEKIKEYGEMFLGKVTKPLYDFMANNVLPYILEHIKKLTEQVDDFYSKMGKVIDIVRKFIKAFIKGDFDTIYEILKKIVPDSLKNKVKDITTLIAKFRKGVKWLTDELKKAYKWLKEKLGKALDYLWKRIEEKVMPVLGDFITKMSDTDFTPVIKMVDSLKDAFEDLEPFLEKLVKWIIDLELSRLVIFIKLLGKLITFTLNVITIILALQKAFDSVSKEIGKLSRSILNFYNFIIRLVGTIIGYIVGFCSNIIEEFQNLYDKLIGSSIIPDLINGIINWFKKLPGSLSGIIGNMASKVVNKFNDLKKSVTDKVKTMGSNVGTKFNNMKTSIINKVNNIKTSVVNRFNTLKSSVITKVNGLKTSVVNKFNTLKSSVITKVNGLKTSVVNRFNTMKSSVINKVNNIKTSVVNRFNTMKSSVITKVNDLKTSAINRFNTMKSSLVNTVNNLKTSVVSRFNTLKTNIKNAVNINLYSAGRNVMTTFISGLQSKSASLGSTLGKISGTIANYMQYRSPAKEGPGKTADKWMPNLMNMLIKDIENYKGKLASTLSDMSGIIQTSIAIPSIESPKTVSTTTGNNFNIKIYANNYTNGRSVGRDLVAELNRKGILTHKGGI